MRQPQKQTWALCYGKCLSHGSWLVANRTQEALYPQYFSLGAVPSSTHKAGCPLGSTEETEEAELLVSPGHCAISGNGRLAHLHSLYE